MQNRYTADVGDYAKYGLLRHLARETEATLGIAWYLVPDESHNDDGRHTSYLDRRDEYRPADPELFRALSEIIAEGTRNVQAIEASNLLGPAIFHHACLDLTPVPFQQRTAVRQAWANEAIQAVRDAQIVFVDPDNGLSVPGTRENSPKASKYVYDQDVAGFWANGPHALIIYQHAAREGDISQQASAHQARIKSLLGIEPIVIRWTTYSLRMFLVITQNERVLAAIDSLLKGPWGAWFKKV